MKQRAVGPNLILISEDLDEVFCRSHLQICTIRPRARCRLIFQLPTPQLQSLKILYRWTVTQWKLGLDASLEYLQVCSGGIHSKCLFLFWRFLLFVVSSVYHGKFCWCGRAFLFGHANNICLVVSSVTKTALLWNTEITVACCSSMPEAGGPDWTMADNSMCSIQGVCISSNRAALESATIEALVQPCCICVHHSREQRQKAQYALIAQFFRVCWRRIDRAPIVLGKMMRNEFEI